MSWLLRGRRALSWREKTLESTSAPPMPLMVFFGLVMLLMYFANYSVYKAQAERTMISFKLLFFLLPVLLILFMHVTLVIDRWLYMGGSRIGYGAPSTTIYHDGSSPWGLALVVLMLLVLVYYQSSVHHSWFRHV